eukprot:5278642-Prymnesium_polylepis.1
MLWEIAQLGLAICRFKPSLRALSSCCGCDDPGADDLGLGARGHGRHEWTGRRLATADLAPRCQARPADGGRRRAGRERDKVVPVQHRAAGAAGFVGGGATVERRAAALALGA